MKSIWSFALLSLLATASAGAETAPEGFFPENDLSIAEHRSGSTDANIRSPRVIRRGARNLGYGDGGYGNPDYEDGDYESSRMTKEQYDAVMNKMERIFTPTLKKMGGKLSIVDAWNYDKVNARAVREGDTYYIKVFGGLARLPGMTTDGLAIVACHELGHHIGGAPRYFKEIRETTDEGQADYWAALKCMRFYTFDEDSVKAIRDVRVPYQVEERCEKAFSEANDKAVCIRSALAGFAVLSAMETEKYREIPSFSAAEHYRPRTTYHKHASAQCRLDTYVAAAACPVPKEEHVDNKNADTGSCSLSRFPEAARPACWYVDPKAGPPRSPDNPYDDPYRDFEDYERDGL